MSTRKKIVVIDGHPDRDRARFVHALADAYSAAAVDAGHEVQRVDVGELEFPLIRTEADWKSGDVPPDILDAQQRIQAAEHLVLFYPLWLGDVPALVKAFLEQTFRPDFAFEENESAIFKRKLRGRSARLVVTMGMPGFVYRYIYCEHSLKSLARNIFKFVGFAPVKKTVFGSVGAMKEARANGYLKTVRELGRLGR